MVIILLRSIQPSKRLSAQTNQTNKETNKQRNKLGKETKKQTIQKKTIQTKGEINKNINKRTNKRMQGGAGRLYRPERPKGQKDKVKRPALTHFEYIRGSYFKIQPLRT